MKREHAEALQRNIEFSISEIIAESETEISFTITGKLKVKFEDVIFLFNTETYECIELKINQFEDFDEIKEDISMIESYFKEEKKDIERLVWSYKNITELIE